VKTIIGAAAAGLAFFLSTGAHAAIVTYTYQAKVASITVQENPAGDFMNVAQSGFAGKSVALGDFITGSFQYDTTAGLSSYQPPAQAGVTYQMYDSGVTDYISYVDQTTGLTFESMQSMNWLGNTLVRDSSPVPGAFAADYFGMTRQTSDGVIFQGATIFLDDLYGNAFQSTALPTELSLSSFQYPSLASSFLRISDSGFMMFSADITSLERVEVPEPSSAFLFAIAASGLFGLRRLRR
jgi:hypothetical protein